MVQSEIEDALGVDRPVPPVAREGSGAAAVLLDEPAARRPTLPCAHPTRTTRRRG